MGNYFRHIFGARPRFAVMKHEMMKAVIFESYGGPEVLQVVDVAKPIPAMNEMLVRVHATTVTSADRRLRSMDMPYGFGLIARAVFGVAKPRNQILGSEFSGKIESVGTKVTRFKIGDKVFGLSGPSLGCHAEYLCIAETGAVAIKPGNLNHRQAAALSFGGTTALDFLRRAQLRANEKILINGASGCVGSAAIQLSRHFGAEVTGVCGPTNTSIVESLGAHRVIDYTVQDSTVSGNIYDVILDAVGNYSFSRAAGNLKSNGRLLLMAPDVWDILQVHVVELTTSKRIIAGPAAESPDDIKMLARLACKGWLKPLIDKIYTLNDIAAAHRYVDTGRKRGSVVIDLMF